MVSSREIRRDFQLQTAEGVHRSEEFSKKKGMGQRQSPPITREQWDQ
jgi:hypothetical protein